MIPRSFWMLLVACSALAAGCSSTTDSSMGNGDGGMSALAGQSGSGASSGMGSMLTDGGLGGAGGTTPANGGAGQAGIIEPPDANGDAADASNPPPPPPPFKGKLAVLDYSPYRDGQSPGGAQPTEAQIREDLVMLKPLTTGIRIYSTTGPSAVIPALCDELGIELHLGAWIDGVAQDTANAMDLARVVNEGHPSIKTAVVGNEVLHRTKTNGMTEAKLVDLVNLVRSSINVTGVRIAAAETYVQWMAMGDALPSSVDVIIWHTYAWWSGVDIKDAYTTVYGRYQDMVQKYPGRELILGETGWPTEVDHVSDDMTSTSVGSVENQARYYREILSGFKQAGITVWMFDAIDEQWKGGQGEGDVGAHWGIFGTDRTPKQAAMDLIANLN